MGTTIRIEMAPTSLRQVDHERQVLEELRCGRIPVSVYREVRVIRQRSIPSGLRLRQGLESGLHVQSTRASLREDRSAEVSTFLLRDIRDKEDFSVTFRL